jgi:hypothetical protein
MDRFIQKWQKNLDQIILKPVLFADDQLITESEENLPKTACRLIKLALGYNLMRAKVMAFKGNTL